MSINKEVYEIFKFELPTENCMIFEEIKETEEKSVIYALVSEPYEYLSIGKDNDCDLVLKDENMCSRHLNLRIAGKTVELFDLNSRTGVFIRVMSSKIPILKYKKLSLAVSGQIYEFDCQKDCCYKFFDECCSMFSSVGFKDYSEWASYLPKEQTSAVEMKEAELDSTHMLSMSILKDRDVDSMDSGLRLKVKPIQLSEIDEDIYL